jgi:hypothetical protein
MTKKNTRPSNRDARDSHTNLDSRYGSIGISAVAAALQFKREVKKVAHAPAVTPSDDRDEMAA